MSLTIPPAKNYQSPLIAVPMRLLRPPADGPRGISLEFDWATMGMQTGSQSAIYVNLSNNANLRFSQIVSLKVDNSQCGADVQIIFTDTSDTVIIPAGEPNAVFPVFTDQTQFYAIARGVIVSTDVTRIQVLNFVPPPVALNSSDEQNVVTSSTAFMESTGVHLVAATESGTLQSLFMSMSVPTAPAGAASSAFTIVDGSGANYLLNTLRVSLNAVVVPYQILYSAENLNWRFGGGITLNNFALGWPAGTAPLNIVATYSKP